MKTDQDSNFSDVPLGEGLTRPRGIGQPASSSRRAQPRSPVSDGGARLGLPVRSRQKSPDYARFARDQYERQRSTERANPREIEQDGDADTVENDIRAEMEAEELASEYWASSDYEVYLDDWQEDE